MDVNRGGSYRIDSDNGLVTRDEASTALVPHAGEAGGASPGLDRAAQTATQPSAAMAADPVETDKPARKGK